MELLCEWLTKVCEVLEVSKELLTETPLEEQGWSLLLKIKKIYQNVRV